jgi:hypothetical protein
MDMEEWEQKNWWKYMDDSLRDLMRQSKDLIIFENKRVSNEGGEAYHDYAFAVFPAAKSYEGFLKKVFLDLGLINRAQFSGEHFRIGRALSPTLPKRYRIGWVYGKLVEYCKGEELPMAMWEVWKKARNRTFHYFPYHQEAVGLAEAKVLVEEIAGVMEKAVAAFGLPRA